MRPWSWGSIPRTKRQDGSWGGQHPSDFVISQVDSEVIVEDVGGKLDVAVDELHFLAEIGVKDSELGGVGVDKFVGIDEEGIPLLHPDVSVGLNRPGSVVEVGAVAIHEHPSPAEFHVAYDYLIVLAGSFTENIGPLEEHAPRLIAVGRRDCRPDGSIVAFAALSTGGLGADADDKRGHDRHEQPSQPPFR